MRQIIRGITAIAIALICSTTSYATGSDTLYLELNDALAVALSKNPTIKIADQEIVKKGYEKQGAYSSLYPQIDFDMSYQRTLKRQVMVIEDVSIPIGQTNAAVPMFSASMPIVAPALWSSLKISAMDVELAVEQARSSHIDMIEQVSTAFYAVLLANDTYHVYKENYDNAVTNYENIKAKYDAGLTSEYDMLRSSVSVKNAEPNLYDAQNAIILTRWRLKALMGVDLDMAIECKGALDDYKYLLAESRLVGSNSLENNSALKQIDLQEQMLEETLKMRKRAFAPTLSLSTSYQWSGISNSFKFTWYPYSVAALTLSVPIFSGMKRSSDIKQAKIDLTKIALQREDAERNLNVSVLSYTNSMLTCIKQYMAAESSIEEAQKGYDISTKRYELGSGTFIDITDSRLALTLAQLNLSQSIYNYMIAKISIEKIYGAIDHTPTK